MSGYLDEYRNEKNELIAFSQMIFKGKVLRGMWFYQVDKLGTFFDIIRISIKRAIEMDEIEVIDFGPNHIGAISELKLKFGAVNIFDWHSACDYSGPFRTLPSSLYF